MSTSQQRQWNLFFDTPDERNRSCGISRLFCYLGLIFLIFFAYNDIFKSDEGESEPPEWSLQQQIDTFERVEQCNENVFLMFNSTLEQIKLIYTTTEESNANSALTLNEPAEISSIARRESSDTNCEFFVMFYEESLWGLLTLELSEDIWSSSLSTFQLDFTGPRPSKSIFYPDFPDEVLLFTDGNSSITSLNLTTNELREIQLDNFVLPSSLAVTVVSDSYFILYGIEVGGVSLTKVFYEGGDTPKILTEPIITNTSFISDAKNYWGDDYSNHVSDFMRKGVDILEYNNYIYLFGGVNSDGVVNLDEVLVTNLDGSLSCDNDYEFPFCLSRTESLAATTVLESENYNQTGFIRSGSFNVFTSEASLFAVEERSAGLVTIALTDRYLYLPQGVQDLGSLLHALMILSLGCTCTFIFLISFNGYLQRRITSGNHNTQDADWLHQLFGLNIGSTQEEGVSKELLKKLPTLPYKQVVEAKSDNLSGVTPVAFEAECCCICLSEFQPEASTTILPCKHLYHKDCINSWFAKNNLCPLCKEKVTQENVTKLLANIQNKKAIALS